jgi:hypothetical protein
VQSQLETLASSGDLMRTLGDAGFKALEYSLDSAMVDSSGWFPLHIFWHCLTPIVFPNAKQLQFPLPSPNEIPNDKP